MLRQSYCHRGMFWGQEVIDYINAKLKATWSPEQIANTPCELDLPSFKTIYRWIYQKYLVKGNLKVLRRKGKKSKYAGVRGNVRKEGKSIRQRDESIYSREEFGHWECDTVLSGRGKSKACFVTMLERKTRYYIAIKVTGRTAKEVTEAIVKELSTLPNNSVKTITVDNGSEFAKWKEIEQRLNTLVYFTDPYCAWQKGSNENSNGLIREFYPKGRNLSKVSIKGLKNNLALINARPKKVLNYKTPVDLFKQELQVLHFT